MAYTSIEYLHDGGRSIEDQIQELSLFSIRVSGEQRRWGWEALQRGEQPEMSATDGVKLKSEQVFTPAAGGHLEEMMEGVC